MGLFFNAMRDSEKSTTLATRLETLNTFFTYLLYCNISRSLFEKDKMLLSFLICATIWLKQGKILHEEFSFFVIGGLTLSGEQAKNPVNWLADKLWTEMIILSSLPNFGVSSYFSTPLRSLSVVQATAEDKCKSPDQQLARNSFMNCDICMIMTCSHVLTSSGA